MITHEIKGAWRRVAARPGYALLSVVVLAMGLGSTLFLLGIINGTMLKPLPFPHAERLVTIGYLPVGETQGINGLDADDYLTLTPALRSYDALGAFTIATVNLTRQEGATRYQGALITKEVLPMLGVAPVLGRAFSAADDRPGAPLTVLLSDRVWRNDFGADPAIVGRTIRANSQPATIIGVMPPKFAFPFREEVWLSRRASAGDEFGADVIARLAPGITIQAARAELESVAARLKNQLADMRGDQRPVIKPLATLFVGEDGRKLLWIMFATSVLVLLLACANVANLTYTQTIARSRELAVRSALGADRRRLVFALIVETFVLSALATAIALVLAHFGGRWIMDALIAAEDQPGYFISFGVDWRMGGYAIAAALVATVAAGLIPALRATGRGVQGALRDGGRGGGRGFARAARTLVVAEIAITCVVLVSAGIFIRALDRIVAFDFGTGADPSHVLTARMGLFPEDFPTPAAQLAFYRRVVEAVRADPAVESASIANALPGTASGGQDAVEAIGEPKPAHGHPLAYLGQIDRYFAETYGIGLTAGRNFDERDVEGAEPVAIVDRRLAETLWPGRDALGQKLKYAPDDPESKVLTVVGTFEQVQLEDVDDPHRPALFVPIEQNGSRFVTIATRVRGDPLAFAPRLAELVRGQNADTPVYWVRTQARAIEMGRIGPVLIAQVFSGVGLLALVLAAAGLYGVLSFAVTQRTREIGVRRAVGASQAAVVRTVGDRILWQLGIGLVIGCAIAWPWSSLLLDTAIEAERDPSTFLLAIGTIVLAALFAAIVPLRRALRVDPLIALRHE